MTDLNSLTAAWTAFVLAEDPDFADQTSPEAAALAHAALLDATHPEHRLYLGRAAYFARWIAKGANALTGEDRLSHERALLEEIADSLEPRALPFLLGVPSILARQSELERLAVESRPRLARNRASRKLARGLPLSSLSAAERAALDARPAR